MVEPLDCVWLLLYVEDYGWIRFDSHLQEEHSARPKWMFWLAFLAQPTSQAWEDLMDCWHQESESQCDLDEISIK